MTWYMYLIPSLTVLLFYGFLFERAGKSQRSIIDTLRGLKVKRSRATVLLIDISIICLSIIALLTPLFIATSVRQGSVAPTKFLTEVMQSLTPNKIDSLGNSRFYMCEPMYSVVENYHYIGVIHLFGFYIVYTFFLAARQFNFSNLVSILSTLKILSYASLIVPTTLLLPSVFCSFQMMKSIYTPWLIFGVSQFILSTIESRRYAARNRVVDKPL